MAACDGFRLTIIGKGGHGAYPENCIDSVVIAAQIITAVQQIVSRRISAIEPAVITIGSIRSSSSRGNVISDSVVLLGTIRSFSTATRERLREEVERVCSIIRSFGAEYKLEYEIGYPPTVNDRQIAAVMKEVATELIGADNVVELPPKTWSEDFSMLAEVSPGAFMFLGGEMNDYRRSHHSPDFDINENGLFIGSAILAATALRLLEQSE